MKKNIQNTKSLVIASTVAAASFIVLTVFASGLVEFSYEVGMLRWMRDLLIYSFANKFGYKLIASSVLWVAVYFATTMVYYSKTVKAKKRARTTKICFTPTDSGVGRIA
ncbi:hypothetical protein V6615_10595 [Oscillospiraceae bacterium PP1C4]